MCGLIARFVACLPLGEFEELFQALSQFCSFGQPQGQALTDPLGKGEQFQFLSQFTVVSLFCFFQVLEVFIEQRLFWEAGSIHPRQLRLVLIAPPVGPRHVHHLDGLDHARIRYVSSPAQMCEVAVVAEGDAAVFQILYEFGLVLIARVCSECFRLTHRTHLEFGFFPGQFDHFGLQGGKILLGKGLLPKIHIVVEAVFNGRSYGEFGIGIDLQQSLSHDMGRGVPKGLFALRVVPGEQPKTAISWKFGRSLNGLSVPLRRKDIPGQTLGYTFGHI